MRQIKVRCGRFLGALALCALFVNAGSAVLFGQVKRAAARAGQEQTQQGRARRQGARRPPQLRNPEAAGLLLSLLARYAEGVPAGSQNSYDRAVARALGPDARVKATVRGMLSRIRQKPELTRALPAQYRELSPTGFPELKYRRTFSQVAKPTVSEVEREWEEGFTKLPQPPPATPDVLIYYRGLWCIDETSDGSASDEPYLITSVVDADHNVRTVKHPFGGISYEDVDDGEKPSGPEVTIYNGKAKDVAVIAVLMEHDFGDPDHFRDEIDALVKAAAAAATAATGVPIPPEVTGLLTDFINWLTGATDDLIEQDNRFFPKDDLLGMAASPLKTKEKLGPPGAPQVLDVNAAHPYHFRTWHVGDGGWYRAYYRVKTP